MDEIILHIHEALTQFFFSLLKLGGSLMDTEGVLQYHFLTGAIMCEPQADLLRVNIVLLNLL